MSEGIGKDIRTMLRLYDAVNERAQDLGRYWFHSVHPDSAGNFYGVVDPLDDMSALRQMVEDGTVDIVIDVYVKPDLHGGRYSDDMVENHIVSIPLADFEGDYRAWVDEQGAVALEERIKEQEKIEQSKARSEIAELHRLAEAHGFTVTGRTKNNVEEQKLPRA